MLARKLGGVDCRGGGPGVPRAPLVDPGGVRDAVLGRVAARGRIGARDRTGVTWDHGIGKIQRRGASVSRSRARSTSGSTRRALGRPL